MRLFGLPRSGVHLFLVIACLVGLLAFQQHLLAQAATTQPIDPLAGIEPELIEVNWLQEMMKGGWTILFQVLISVGMVAFAIEHFVRLRARNIAPDKLTAEIMPLISTRDYQGATEKLQADGSLMAHALSHAIQHRSADHEFLSNRVSEFGSRELEDHEQRLAVFTGVAAVEPLLGLLGTMIGMIEAFKLVSVFGDEGGAAMLADSISKALITTAFGLVVAIPAICLHQYFRHRLHNLSLKVEREAEVVVRQIVLNETARKHHAAPVTTTA